MKTIGLIGGMSWESTNQYYSLINVGINRYLSKNHSSKCIIYSFDFQEIEDLQYAGEWDKLRGKILDAGKILKNAGSDFVLLCTNTMHKVVNGFYEEVGIPIVHIAEAVGAAVTNSKIKTVGLLGTIFTMEEDFYKERLKNKYSLNVIIPDSEDRTIINKIIYEELVKGIIKEESRESYYRVMNEMKKKGSEGIILGCTEIGLLIKEYDLPLFDSTIIHAENAVEISLGKKNV